MDISTNNWQISISKSNCGEYCAIFDYDKEVISLVKTYGYGRWNGSCWILPPSGALAFINKFKDHVSLLQFTIEDLEKDAKAAKQPGYIYIEKCKEGFTASFLYDAKLVSKIKETGCGKWVPDKKYWVLTPKHVLELLDKYKEDCVISDELLSEVKERAENVIPMVNYKFKSTPYPHQIECFNYIIDKKKVLVADEPGLGKTAEGIYASDYLKKSDRVRKCLIICGVNTIKYNWLNEIKLHSDEKAILIDGTEQKRLEAIQEWKNSDIYYGIINIEALRKSETLNSLKNVAGCIIVDEIHKAKNGLSQQGKAVRSLNAAYKIGLTGTPIDNKVEDLYNILAWLGVEKRSFTKFRDAYCYLDKWGSVTGYHNLGDLKKELSRVMIRRKKEDVVDLPEKIYKTEYVELSKEEKKKYRELQKGILNDINKILNMDNPLSSIFHLREVTGGLYTEIKDNAKLARIKEIIQDEIIPAGKKVIVFSKYEEIAKIYKNELSEYHPAYITGSVDPKVRDKEVECFQNDPECKVCIGTIGAMGTGITLTAASTVIFADKDWTVSSNRQAEDRAHRIGTKENVNIITVVAKDTIDEYVEQILNDKVLYTDLVMEGTDDVVKKENRPQLIADLLGITTAELKALSAKAKAAKKVEKAEHTQAIA